MHTHFFHPPFTYTLPLFPLFSICALIFFLSFFLSKFPHPHSPVPVLHHPTTPSLTSMHIRLFCGLQGRGVLGFWVVSSLMFIWFISISIKFILISLFIPTPVSPTGNQSNHTIQVVCLDPTFLHSAACDGYGYGWCMVGMIGKVKSIVL